MNLYFFRQIQRKECIPGGMSVFPKNSIGNGEESGMCNVAHKVLSKLVGNNLPYGQGSAIDKDENEC